MCGICGVFDREGTRLGPDYPERLRAMSDAMRHRGPDDDGLLIEHAAGLGFRRLAILDLSPQANQPLQVGDRVASVFNGEIYNYRELREELLRDGVELRSNGDAEVIPHLYLRHGPDFVERLEGMFALAVLDRKKHALLLARDRFGKKPLYYRADGERLWFSSEPKGLLAGGAVAAPDPAAMVRFLACGYVPGEGSAFAGFHRVPVGGRVLVAREEIRVERYYTPPEPSPVVRPIGEWKDAVFSALTRAVERRLQSDVPVGVFLSGGIDSGLILAALRASGSPLPQTFTIGFEDRRFDERKLAAASARHLGVEPEVLVAPSFADEATAKEALHEVTRVYDEPFGDPSAYPTLLLSRLARQHVTVALSGDGGDEVFGGYRRHAALGLADKIARVAPRPLRRQIARLVGEAGNGTGGRGPMGQLRRFAAAVGLDPAARNGYWSSLFRAPLRAQFLHPDLLMHADSVDPDQESVAAFSSFSGSPLRRAMRYDLLRYLPDDLLVKTDMASMSCSLEVRAPFLDPEVVALAAGLGDDLLVRGRETKVLLRALALDHLPPEVASARKRGFGVPLASWLCGPLQSTAKEWLTGDRFRARGILRDGAARELIARHQSGREDWSSYLWALLILEGWHRRHIDGDPEWAA